MTIVLDANIGVWAVVEHPLSDRVDELLSSWLTGDSELLAPQLWVCEVTSAIRKHVALGKLTMEFAEASLEAALRLPVRRIPETPELCRSAFRWAERLNQAAAYDGFYLALAEETRGEFWTADLGLARRAEQLGLSWVHPIEREP